MEQTAYENQFRRANWEAGQIDYLGNFLKINWKPNKTELTTLLNFTQVKIHSTIS